MAIPAIAQVVTGTSTGLSTVVATITIGSGADRLLVILVNQDKGGQVSGVDITGSAATFVKRGTPANDPRAEIWYFIAPATGLKTVTATGTSSPEELRITVIELTGADQSSPIDVSYSSDVTTQTNTINGTTTVNDCLLACVSSNKDVAPTWGASQTQRSTFAWTGGLSGGTSTKDAASAGAISMSATANIANHQVLIVAAIKSSSASSIVIPVLLAPLAQRAMRGWFKNG